MKSLYPLLLVLIGLFQISGFAATEARKTPPKRVAKKASSNKKPAPKAAVKPAPAKRATAPKPGVKAKPKAGVAKPASKRRVVRKRAYKAAPPVDPTDGDNVDGDDLTVRRAAADALGTLNGAVVAVDPSNGRVLSIVNQKLALKSGFIPCSTIKLVTGLAALNEGLIERDQNVRVGRYANFNLTTAIAHSNNQYFQRLGNQLGFDRVTHYARMLGLGEKAGWEIAGEEPGAWPDKAPGAGGVGMMTACGENILMTPLELAALLSAIANNGDLYYLQYPRTPEEAEEFTPRLKRKLDLAASDISDIKVGMRGAVDFGTARRAGYNSDQPILGKTGTCTDFRESNHMGWFGSFNEVDHHQLVIVVMLLGTKTVSGPVASGVAGEIYRKLAEERYFAADLNALSGPGPTYSSACCSSR
jgi:penicillin-binding protein 2